MKRTKMLVVEDNEDNRRILVLRLRHEDKFAICEAATGQEALASITREPPDLVFLNLKRPVLNGGAPGRRMPGLPAPLSHRPLIVVTAHCLVDDRDKGLAAGCAEGMA